MRGYSAGDNMGEKISSSKIKWLITRTDGKEIECPDDSSLMVYLNSCINEVKKIERIQNNC